MWRDFHPSATTISTWFALAILAVLAFLLVFFSVPLSNKELITFVLGAISGALTMGGTSKVADKITNSSGDNATVQPEASTPTEETK